MKSKLLHLAMAMLVASSFCRAQAPCNACAESIIVKAVDKNGYFSLVYAADSSGVRKLMLCNHDLPIAHAATIPPMMVIKDMEVSNGWAYFCGQLGGSAIVGQFEIFGVFNNSSQIYATTVAAGSLASGPYVRVTDATKISLYGDENKVFISAVGEGVHSYDGDMLYLCPTLFHAALDKEAMQWEICADYQETCRPDACADGVAAPGKYRNPCHSIVNTIRYKPSITREPYNRVCR